MAESAPNPETFEIISDGVYKGMAMIAGVKLDLFTPLKDGPMSAEQIADAIGPDANKLGPLLYTLVLTGLLTVNGERFSNTADADHFLVRGRPAYMRERLEFYYDLWISTLDTAETIQTGKPQAKVDYAAMPPDELENFLRGLHWATVRAGRSLAENFDFSPYRNLLDVGGGTGGLAIGVTDAYPHLRATVVDQANVTPIAQRIVAEAGAGERVQVVTADAVCQPLNGTFDVAVLKAFLNILSPEEARGALANVGRVIRPGGAIIIAGGLELDDSRLAPPLLVPFNLVMINIYDSGQLYTEQQHKAWLTEAGFVDIRRQSDVGFVARKPAP